MINLRCVDRTEFDDIESIINEKNNTLSKTVLISLKAKIIERYSKHIEIELNRRIKPISFTDEERNALLSLYNSKTATAKLIVRQILEIPNPNHSDSCLYCGIGEIDQLDHYLPREFFPEYSILHKNLIPICGRCNEIKGSNIPGHEGKNYLHLIYDNLPIDNLFFCKITYQNNLPVVEFSIHPNYVGSLVEEHFNGLKLKTRIEKKSVQYCLQIKALKDQFGDEYAEEEVSRDHKRLKAFFGFFYWKTELLEEMLNTSFVKNIT